MKKVFLTLVLSAFVGLSAFSQFEEEEREETITLTTYYPSPFGVYRDFLVSERMAVGDVSGGPEGMPDGVVNINDLPADHEGNPLLGGLAVARGISIGSKYSQENYKLSIYDDESLFSYGSQTYPVTGLILMNGGLRESEFIEGVSVISLLAGATAGGAEEGWGIAVWSDRARPSGGFFGIHELNADAVRLVIHEGGYVGIGTEEPQGILDVSSTTSAFLPPRLTTAERNEIDPPVAGMVIYNTDTENLEVYDGDRWKSAAGGPGEPKMARLTVNKNHFPKDNKFEKVHPTQLHINFTVPPSGRVLAMLNGLVNQRDGNVCSRLRFALSNGRVGPASAWYSRGGDFSMNVAGSYLFTGLPPGRELTIWAEWGTQKGGGRLTCNASSYAADPDSDDNTEFMNVIVVPMP